MRPLEERLADNRIWWRIAEKHWRDPLDTRFAKIKGGRWNPPNSFACLYLNENITTARTNFRKFTDASPIEPEDLRPENAPVLVQASLPRQQKVCDAHTPAGIEAFGLPKTYPVDAAGKLVGHVRCQSLGREIKRLGLRGVHCRSARSADGAGRELAWFPATARSRARRGKTLDFNSWFRG